MENNIHSKTYILPNSAKENQLKDPISSMLYITDCGYYHTAKSHKRIRTKGAEEHILIYCVSGRGSYSIDNQRTQYIGTGDFFIIEANTPHQYMADTEDPWSIYWVHFKGRKALFFKDFFNRTTHIPPSIYERTKVRIDIFEEIMANFENGYSKENVQYSSLCLWYLLGSFRYVEQFREINKAKQNDPIELAIEFMNANIDKPLTLDDIAKNSGYSASHFGVLFSNKKEQTPIEYLNTLKIKKACNDLKFSQKNIKEIAFSLGFSNQYYFCKVFKKVMGMTPTKYRNYDAG